MPFSWCCQRTGAQRRGHSAHAGPRLGNSRSVCRCASSALTFRNAAGITLLLLVCKLAVPAAGRTFTVQTQPLPRHASSAWCSEIVQGFDFTNYSDVGFLRFAACLDRRHELPDWQSSAKPSVITGEHYPVLVTPSSSHQSPAGYWVVPAWDYVVSNAIRREGTMEPAELELLHMLTQEGNTVLDIGANVGAYTVPLAIRVGRSGSVHAFEPFRRVAQLLTANVAINGLGNVFVHQLALGERAESKHVRSPALARANNVGATAVHAQLAEQWSREHVVQYDGEEMVSIITLDSVDVGKVDLMKVDVEGSLGQVLRGAESMIAKSRPLVAAEHFGSGGPELLLAWGYRCEEVIKFHNLWVCVPLERWAEYDWLVPLAEGLGDATFRRIA